ncbi:DUF4167 domain-containing protein [Azospirillum argentinense]
MSCENSLGFRTLGRRFGNVCPQPSQNHIVPRAPARANGNAQQKHGQWLSRADEAERSGDDVQAELCRQYAEHWFRVSRGQE